jgi:hypothetical protein
MAFPREGTLLRGGRRGRRGLVSDSMLGNR